MAPLLSDAPDLHGYPHLEPLPNCPSAIKTAESTVAKSMIDRSLLERHLLWPSYRIESQHLAPSSEAECVQSPLGSRYEDNYRLVTPLDCGEKEAREAPLANGWSAALTRQRDHVESDQRNPYIWLRDSVGLGRREPIVCSPSLISTCFVRRTASYTLASSRHYKQHIRNTI
ncbi:hypothetical protein V1477_020618 [Vespula maculifrons]|uniref:Uncharacterized protein n=1 Tax=Vespula maculifrons TaxID=7453 RepID=A0ABD2AMF0_VESMC